eukprot:1704285-Prymnesium_polylepis.1
MSKRSMLPRGTPCAQGGGGGGEMPEKRLPLALLRLRLSCALLTPHASTPVSTSSLASGSAAGPPLQLPQLCFRRA